MAKKRTAADPEKTLQIGTTLSRYVSFVMLVVTILVCGFYFYNVIKGFLLPLFLAVLLAVIFRPFHQFVASKCKHRAALAAAISTSVIMFIVLVPLAGLLALGLYEGNQVIRDRKIYLAKVNEIRGSLGLQKPFAQPLDKIETELRKLDDAFSEGLEIAAMASMLQRSAGAIRAEVQTLKQIGRDAAKDMWSDVAQTPMGTWFSRYERRLSGAPAQGEPTDPEKSARDLFSARALEIRAELLVDADISPAEADYIIALSAMRNELVGATHEVGPLGDEFASVDRTPEKKALRYLVKRSILKPESGFLPRLASFEQSMSGWEDDPAASRMAQREAFTDTQVAYVQLRTGLFRGPLWKWALELLNPSSQQINEWLTTEVAGGAARWLPSITNTATSLIVGLLVGLGIMSVALFYFFMDGPTMINTFMHLSPLDDRHEMELLIEFDKVSRAVVLATLLSAVAQGILGGIGYKLVGIESVFLLTLLTTVLALVPFIGAAAIWVPCCLYLAFIQESTAPGSSRGWLYAKAAFLAVYGFGIISMADNIIKPWVLQGQSKLHPLLALLSVLGGVQALGPIGILVGPMVVAFLQVLLTILQREITSFDEEMKKSSASE